MSQYLDMFFDESREHLQAINKNLLDLEQSPADLEILSTVFRSAHTLKGMSATMGFENMAHLTHEMENALDLMRNGKLAVTPVVMDLLFRCVDLLESMLPAILDSGSDAAVIVDDCIEDLKTLVSGKPLPAKEATQNTAAGTPAGESQNTGSEMAFNTYESTILEQSLEQGFSAYQVKVVLASTCVLKAARVYMIMAAFESGGEVIRTEPSVEELEEENFDNSFTALYLTKLSQEEVEALVLNISEVSECHATPIPIHSENEAAAASAVQVASDVQDVVKPEVKASQAPEKKPAQTERKVTAGKSVRVDIDRLDILMNLFSELVIDRTRLEQIADDLNHPDLVETVEHMSRVSSDLQNIVMTIRMVPVDTVFNRFPRMVRDLARDLGKKVEFVVRGAETELDRTVIDEIGDPLVHMLRNSLDHALETPEERHTAGKDETGRLELIAYHSGNHVFIEVVDDGRGIDRNKILKRAIERNLIDSDKSELLSDESVFDLLFRSGFSTAEKVSDLSGRGVGLDVVKSKIESLGGRVVVQSVLGKGTKFIIQLPLTLSIIQALLVNVAEEKFAIPLSSIIETATFKKSKIKRVHKQDVMDFRGRVIPLVYLENIFSVPRDNRHAHDECNVVIVRKGEKVAALVVDAFMGQQEVVLKSLGKYLSVGVFAISGATILGDGQVALILDCNSLVR